jgi:hypothetical protein
MEAELERYKIEKQAELERYKAQLQAEVELQKAQIAAGAQVRAAVKTQTGEDPGSDEDQAAEKERVTKRDQTQDTLAQALMQLADAMANPPDKAIVIRNGVKTAVTVPRQRAQ